MTTIVFERLYQQFVWYKPPHLEDQFGPQLIPAGGSVNGHQSLISQIRHWNIQIEFISATFWLLEVWNFH